MKITKSISLSVIEECKNLNKDDIENFYSELKEIEQYIIIENNNKESFIRIKDANK